MSQLKWSDNEIIKPQCLSFLAKPHFINAGWSDFLGKPLPPFFGFYVTRIMSKLCEACVNAHCSVEMACWFRFGIAFVKTKETVADAEPGVAGKKEKTSCRRKRWTNRLPRLIYLVQLPPKETSSLNPEQNLLERIPDATHSSGQINRQNNHDR